MEESPSVSLDTLLKKVKSSPNISKAGMILCHNGIVRDFSRVGDKTVCRLSVSVDSVAINDLKKWALIQPGMVAVEIEAMEGEFDVGDDLMFVVLAGDVRENVFAVMRELIERIKTTCVSKKELCD